jgi:RNA polymerase sigma-70 factor (ECF subfamily)
MTEGQPVRSGWVASALERFERPLLRYATHLLGRADGAQDVVQSTFLKLCREDPAGLDGHLGPWLFRVCRNEAFDVRRNEQRTLPVDQAELTENPSPEPGPARVLEARESLQQVLAALATLPASQQEVLRLKFQESLSYRDISSITGLTVNHVGVLIHNGLKALRARVPRNPDQSDPRRAR